MGVCSGRRSETMRPQEIALRVSSISARKNWDAFPNTFQPRRGTWSFYLKLTCVMADQGRGLDRSAKSAEIVSAVTVVVGLGLGILGYVNEREARRERFTFDYAEQLYEPTLHAVRARLLTRVRAREDALPPGTTAPSLAAYFERKVQANSVDAAELRADLLTLLDHYNGASGCIDAGLCDRDLLRMLYLDEAESVHSIFGLAMAKIGRRGQSEELMEGVLRFVDQ